MSKLCLGGITEMAQRVKTLEDTNVLKSFDADEASGDIIIVEDEED
jgi:hypothetical protein